MSMKRFLSHVKRSLVPTLSAVLLVAAATSVNAQVVYDDAVDGNASSIGSSPTSLVFGIGSNVVNGTVTTTTNIRNFYTFTIGAGQELSAINLDAINVTTATGDVSNDPGFFALVAGPTASIPAAGFSNLGGNLYSPENFGDNLLANISDGGISDGTGFSNIGAGDYTFVIQQTGDEVSNFSLDFQVTSAIPEPTSVSLLVGLGLAGLTRRRRR
jgi:hypothetical protein